jgi:preprotein translocase subunit YajC
MRMQGVEIAPESSRAPEGAGAQPVWWNQVPILLFGVLMALWLFRQSRRDKQEKQKLLDNLQKNDKVLTIGGIYGTVVALGEQGDDVTLKIDDDVKIRITRSSILRNISREEAARAGAAGSAAKDSK